MIEIVRDPLLQKTKTAEIDHEATLIKAVATKLNLDGPVMPVQERAMPLMPVLAMGERDIPIGLAAGEHAQGRIRRGQGHAARHIMAPP